MMRLEYVGLALLVIVMIIACGPSQEELQGQIDDRILANAESLRGPKGDQGVPGPQGLSLVVTATATHVPTPTQTAVPVPTPVPTPVVIPTPVPTPVLTVAKEFGGVIQTDITLVAKHSPYIVSRNTLISSQAKVKVEPGVELRFMENIGLVVQGEFIVNQEDKEVVRFVPHEEKPWAGITFADGSKPTRLNVVSEDYKEGSLLRGCFIRNPIYNNLDKGNVGTALVIKNNLLIDNCEVVGKDSRITHWKSIGDPCRGLDDMVVKNLLAADPSACERTINNRGTGIEIFGDNQPDTWGSLRKVVVRGFSELVRVHSLKKLKVTDSVFVNTHGNALTADCDELHVTDSTFQDYIGGLNLRSDNVTIQDNLFSTGFRHGEPLLFEWLSSRFTQAIYTHYGSSGTIAGNVFQHTGYSHSGPAASISTHNIRDGSFPAIIDTFVGRDKELHITNNLFYQNRGTALKLYAPRGSSLKFSDNNFVDHIGHPDIPLILIHDDRGAIVFRGNNFPEITETDMVWIRESSDIGETDAKENWWGTTDEKYFKNAILDFNDDSERGIVHFTPWLEKPNSLVLSSEDIGSKGSSPQINPSWLANPTPTPTSIPATPTPLPGTVGYINFNESKTGSINDSSETHIWVFTGARGNSASVRVKVASGNLNPFLGINSPGGQTVSDDNSGDGVDAFIDVLYLNCTGTYQIVVSAWPGTTGQYEVILTDAPEGSVYDVQPC